MTKAELLLLCHLQEQHIELLKAEVERARQDGYQSGFEDGRDREREENWS